jgi:hypothetical protein
MRCHEINANNGPRFAFPEPWAARHYRCELYGSNGDPPLATTVGSDNGPPEMPDVLDAVAADAAVVEEAGRFEAWAAQMGFDPDSRSGERVYRRTRRQAGLLRRLLGEESYEALLWQTERL